MRITKRDQYSLNVSIESMSESELRDLKFGLNFRYIAHMKKNHTKAADSAKALTDSIRAELARRVQAKALV